jgi:hypothetical protein
MFESEVVHDVMKWSGKKNVTIVSICHGSEVQAIIKKGKGKQKLVCMIHYCNQNIVCTDEEDQLLQIYLVE